ncbi:MAG: IS1634 family transposase [Oligoflexia bacterium]|nr:IS1634 family transposase [Oligoflexia bacterium]
MNDVVTISNDIITQPVAHLGIVAGILKKIGLANKVDQLLPKTSNNYTVSHGNAVAAMILNGLGFVERRLYMVSTFFKDLPVAELIDPHITADMLNDDVLGRTLDAIHEYGVTKLYSNIAFEIGNENGLFNKFAHLDSTTISVSGKYSGQEEEAAQVTFGHSKDHRPDLKQLTLSLTMTGKSSFPLWMESLSGNSSDKDSFHNTIDTIRKFQEEINRSQPFIWVADAALYSANKLLKKGNSIYWISRVPETINEAKRYLQKNDKSYQWNKIDDNYHYTLLKSNYGEVAQRWLLVKSEDAYAREILTFESNIDLKFNALADKIKKINKTIYETKKIAEHECKDLIKKNPLFNITYNIAEEYKKSGLEKELIGFKVEIKFTKNYVNIQKERNMKGRFIIATNYHDLKFLPDHAMLSEYKKQSQVEKGFRFIKDKSFLVSDMYLKKNTSLESLMLIMCFSLMVYNLAEFWLRKSLRESNATVPNQIGKQISNPTLKWIFQMMRNICYVQLSINGVFQKVITNFNDTHRKILELFGGEILKIYGIPSA